MRPPLGVKTPDIRGLRSGGWWNDISPWGQGDPTLVGATQVEGRLGVVPVNRMSTLSAVLGGDAATADDAQGRKGRTGVKNEVAWTAPGGIAGATETVNESHGNGRARSSCGGIRETAKSRVRA